MSKNKLLISVAVFSSISALVAKIPPNALTGSQDNGSFHASKTSDLVATPHALLCLIITKVLPGVSLNSFNKQIDFIILKYRYINYELTTPY